MMHKKLAQNQLGMIKSYDEITQHSDDITVRIDPDHRISYISPAIERYTTTQRTDLIGKRILALQMPGPVNELLTAAIKSALKKEKVGRVHFSAPVNGEMLHFETRFFPSYDHSDDVHGVVVVAKDITEASKTKKSKDKRYTQRVLLSEFAKDCVTAGPGNREVLINKTLMQLGTYLDADRAYMFRYNFENGFVSNTHEWVAKNISSEKENLRSVPLIMIPDWVESHSRGESLVVKDVKKLKAGFLREALESQGIKSLATTPLMDEGDCIGFVGIDSVCARRTFGKEEIDALEMVGHLLSNYMSKMRADDKVKAQSSLIKTYLENTFAALYIFRNGVFEYVNQTFCDITEYSEKEVLSPDFDFKTLFYSAQNEAIKAVEERIKGNIEKKEYKVRIRTKQGRLKLVEVHTNALFDSKGMYTVGVAMDISNREKVAKTINRINKELEIKNAELKEFAYMASHNLRAPVANIIGLVDHFAQTLGENEDLKAYLTGIKESSIALNKSLDDMHRVLEVKGDLNSEFEPIDLKDTTRRICRMLAKQINESGIQITTDFKINKLSYVKYHIENLIINLISNAIRYRSESREATLHISSVKVGKTLKISFSDNGLGIDLKRHGHHIFGIYKRFHDHPESRGLGLYLVKSQLEKLGGKIAVESTPNEGTTFVVNLVV